MAERGIRRGYEHDVASPSRWSIKVGRLRAMPEKHEKRNTQSLLVTKTHTGYYPFVEMNMGFYVPGKLCL